MFCGKDKVKKSSQGLDPIESQNSVDQAADTWTTNVITSSTKPVHPI